MTNKSHTPQRPGRPREFDNEAVLDKAIVRFSEHGYNGTSISDLNICLGLTSGSIYKAWGDKRGLFLAALDRYMDTRAEAIHLAVSAVESGRAKIEAILLLYAGMSSDVVGRRGCLVVETAVELSVGDPEIAKRIEAQQKRRETQLRGFIEEAQQDGSARASINAQSTANLIMAIQQGMRVLGKTGRSLDDMQQIVQESMRLFD